MLVEFIARWFHVIFGIVWIGMLYYFNFVQTEYFKEAEADAKADAMKKLAPRALWWFRWGAMFTFLTGLILLYLTGAHSNFKTQPLIWIGSIAGIFMFLNVWLIIWPKQQVVLGMKEGDGPAAAAKAGLASRTNTLFSGPMLFGMLGSNHLPVLWGSGEQAVYAAQLNPMAVYASIALIVLLEINAIVGKLGPMKSVVGVIHCSIGLVVALWGILAFL